MFEVFATVCFFGGMGLAGCDDYVTDSADDQLTCEIVANARRMDTKYINVMCIPSPEVEPMPGGEEVEGDPVVAVTSFFVDHLNAADLVAMYAHQAKD